MVEISVYRVGREKAGSVVTCSLISIFLCLLFSFLSIISCIIGMLAFLALCHGCFFFVFSIYLILSILIAVDEQERNYGYLLFSLEYFVVLGLSVLSSKYFPTQYFLNLLAIT